MRLYLIPFLMIAAVFANDLMEPVMGDLALRSLLDSRIQRREDSPGTRRSLLTAALKQQAEEFRHRGEQVSSSRPQGASSGRQQRPSSSRVSNWVMTAPERSPAYNPPSQQERFRQLAPSASLPSQLPSRSRRTSQEHQRQNLRMVTAGSPRRAPSPMPDTSSRSPPAREPVPDVAMETSSRASSEFKTPSLSDDNSFGSSPFGFSFKSDISTSPSTLSRMADLSLPGSPKRGP